MKKTPVQTAFCLLPMFAAVAAGQVASLDVSSLGLESAAADPAQSVIVHPTERAVIGDVVSDESQLPINVAPEGIVQTASPGLTTYQLFQTPKSEYQVSESRMTLVPANASDFGWFSLESTPFSPSKAICPDQDAISFTGGIGIHFLRGPTITPLESRIFDFIGGIQSRKTINDVFSYDLATSIGVYSDFEGSARDGVRFPSHAVGFVDLGLADLVFGVEYLDREDIKLLPVGGIVVRGEDIRAEFVFPRPRVDIAIDEAASLFFKGNLAGGSWAIERPDESNDVFTYRAFEVTMGIQTVGEESVSSVELGYVFDRSIEFRNTSFEESFGDAFIIRFVSLQ